MFIYSTSNLDDVADPVLNLLRGQIFLSEPLQIVGVAVLAHHPRPVLKGLNPL
jgi:hypothetical protein